MNLPFDHVIVILDFSNAFNCIRRDLILDTTATHTPEIYRLVHSAYSCKPILSFGEHEILSREGAQQGDPLGSLEFCEAIHPLLMSLHSSVKIGFMDDVTISGDLQTVEKYIVTIVESCTETGLRLNTTKCEIVMEDFTKIDGVDAFKDFIRVNKEEMILLGAPVVKGIAQDTAIKNKIDDLTRTTERLQLLHSSTCSR